jgi:cell division protein FtsB
MAQLDRRRFITKLRHSPLAYIVLILFAVLFTYSAIGAYKKSRLAEAKMNAAETELADLENQKSRLTAELENANTEFGQEKALREKFNIVKQGEQVIMIVNKADTETSETPKAKARFWARIFGKK